MSKQPSNRAKPLGKLIEFPRKVVWEPFVGWFASVPGTSFTVWVEGKEGEWSWSVLLSGVVLDGGVKEEPGEAKAAALRFIEATALVIRPVERDNKKEGES